MLGAMNAKLLAFSCLVAAALGAKLQLSGGITAIEVSDTRITNVGGVFTPGQDVDGLEMAAGSLIVADSDNAVVNEIRELWRAREGSSTGIYYELQTVGLLYYPGQTKPWPEDIYYAVYLPPHGTFQ